ncbi:MAG: type II secretion system protein N [Chromatiales bacterium]|jgi:type II secretion system protein C
MTAPKFITDSISPIRLATLISFTLMGVAIAFAVQTFMNNESNKPTASAFEKKENTITSTSRRDYSKLASWNLFGVPIKKDANKIPTAKPVPTAETRLKLELLGTVSNSTSNDGFAIISQDGKQHKTYHTGDNLPGNAVLYAVEKNRVILKRNDRLESLALKKPEETASPETGSRIRLPSTPKFLQKRTSAK